MPHLGTASPIVERCVALNHVLQPGARATTKAAADRDAEAWRRVRASLLECKEEPTDLEEDVEASNFTC